MSEPREDQLTRLRMACRANGTWTVNQPDRDAIGALVDAHAEQAREIRRLQQLPTVEAVTEAERANFMQQLAAKDAEIERLRENHAAAGIPSEPAWPGNDNAGAAAPIDYWRVGRKVPINLYRGDVPVGVIYSGAIDARLVVKAVNALLDRCHAPEKVGQEVLWRGRVLMPLLHYANGMPMALAPEDGQGVPVLLVRAESEGRRLTFEEWDARTPIDPLGNFTSERKRAWLAAGGGE